MNPKKAASTGTTAVIEPSPFDQISTLEDAQEKRVQTAMGQYVREEQELEKTLMSSEKAEEEAFYKQAAAELKEYAKKEPAEILTENEKMTANELKDIAKKSAKNMPEAVSHLTKSVLSFTIFSSR